MINDFENVSTHWQYIRLLRSNGWSAFKKFKNERISAGAGNTVVFISPDEKTAMRVNSGDWKDFKLYTDLAQSLPNNPYLQNIQSEFFLKDGTYCVQLERLYEFDNPKIPPKVKQYSEILYNSLNFPFSDFRQKFMDNALVQDKNLKNFLCSAYSVAESACRQDFCFSAGLDIHTGNLMFRQTEHNDWELVFIDLFEYYVEEDGTYDFFMGQGCSDILWRRKLGFFDYPRNWDLQKNGRLSGCLVID